MCWAGGAAQEARWFGCFRQSRDTKLRAWCRCTCSFRDRRAFTPDGYGLRSPYTVQKWHALLAPWRVLWAAKGYAANSGDVDRQAATWHGSAGGCVYGADWKLLPDGRRRGLHPCSDNKPP